MGSFVRDSHCFNKLSTEIFTGKLFEPVSFRPENATFPQHSSQQDRAFEVQFFSLNSDFLKIHRGRRCTKLEFGTMNCF